MKLNTLMWYIYRFQRKIRIIFGVNNIFRLKAWGGIIGKNPEFQGRCQFRVHKKSRIVIGDNFRCISCLFTPSIIMRPCTIETNSSNACIEIGNNVSMSGSCIVCFNHIKIEDNVRIGGNCIIMDGDFHLNDFRAGLPKEIIIDKNVWIGYSTTILKGVHIGENSLIGACSVVTKDIPSNSVAVGNPCRVIKTF